MPPEVPNSKRSPIQTFSLPTKAPSHPAILQSHPSPSLDRPWKLTQLALVSLAMLPALSGILLLTSSAMVTRRCWGKMQRRGVNHGLVLLSLLLIGSCLGAEYPGEAWLGLVHFLPYFWLGAAQTELIQTPQQRQQGATILALSVVPVVAIGLGELYLGWSSPAALVGILPWPAQAGGTPPGRMASVFGYANHLAIYLNVCLALLLGLWGGCYRGGPAQNDLAQNDLAQNFSPAQHERPWLSRWRRSRLLPFWSLLIIFTLLGLVLTQSRNAWGLALFSGLALAVYGGWRWLGGMVVGFAAAVVWAAFGPVGRGPLRQLIPPFFWARLTDQNFSDRPLATLRWTQWQFTLDLAEARPLMGWGLRNFSPLYEAQTGIWLGHPHNLFLMLAAETGWLTTGGLLGLMGWIFYNGIEVLRTTDHLEMIDRHVFFGILIAFLNVTFFHFFDVPLFDFRINALAWMAIAQILGVVYLSKAGNLYLDRTAIKASPKN